ncbi:hypothetical protein C4K01_3000 [Pseudomonas synxantha]|nr:hypothetical protein C4K01_3000 [Pseudomonas synxantha]
MPANSPEQFNYACQIADVSTKGALRWAPGFKPIERGFLNRCPEQLEVVL